jgi:hypothetical protein
VNDRGNHVVTFSYPNGSVRSVDMGGSSAKNFDTGKFHSDLALRSVGRDVETPQVQQMSPHEASQTLAAINNSDPLKNFIANALGGGGAAADTTAPDSLVQSALAGRLLDTDYLKLNAAQKADLDAKVQAARKTAPPAPGLGSSPLSPAVPAFSPSPVPQVPLAR